MKLNTLLAALGTVALTSAALAQEPIYSTPVAARATYSADLKLLIDQNYPKYEGVRLQKEFDTVAAMYRGRVDNISARSLDGLQRVFALPPSRIAPGQTAVETDQLRYRIFPTIGKTLLAFQPKSDATMTAEEFAAKEAGILKFHQELLRKAGIPADEIFKQKLSKVMVQSIDENGVADKPEILRGLSVTLRAIKGIPVDGSAIKISSRNERELESFRMNWPKFKLHTQISSHAIKNADEIKRNLNVKLAAALPKGGVSRLAMNVVLRPVKLSATSEIVYVPALQARLTPQAIVDRSSVRRDTVIPSGVTVYEDLLAQRVSYDEISQTDE